MVKTHYTVKPGDTLQSIAHHHYGNSGWWSRIFTANAHVKNPDPGALNPGTILVIPK
jgi:nucleoid-associated protein YgaU